MLQTVIARPFQTADIVSEVETIATLLLCDGHSPHFPVQNVAKATYLEIFERRANENGADFVIGVATAITPMAFFDTVMVKGYESLVDSGTKVDVNTGMIAAGRLQALIDSRASGTSIADMLVKMDRIINAIRSTVPEEIWAERWGECPCAGADART